MLSGKGVSFPGYSMESNAADLHPVVIQPVRIVGLCSRRVVPSNGEPSRVRIVPAPVAGLVVAGTQGRDLSLFLEFQPTHDGSRWIPAASAYLKPDRPEAIRPDRSEGVGLLAEP